MKFHSSKDGGKWPRIGHLYLVRIKGLLQHEVFEFDQGDDGVGGGEYFWSREDCDECPAFDPEGDEWLSLSEIDQPRPAHLSRDDVIQCLLATMGQSEGIAADAIMGLFHGGQSRHAVPEEPTHEMVDAFFSDPDKEHFNRFDLFRARYKNLLKAAQQPEGVKESLTTEQPRPAVPELTEQAVQYCYDALYNADGQDRYEVEHKSLIRQHWDCLIGYLNAAQQPEGGEDQ